MRALLPPGSPRGAVGMRGRSRMRYPPSGLKEGAFAQPPPELTIDSLMADRPPESHAMNDAAFRSIGKPLTRKEDERLVTGKGRFSDDFRLDGQAHAVMVRSPYPHARIVGMNKARAQAMPGVLGVFTGADCQHLDPIPHD